MKHPAIPPHPALAFSSPGLLLTKWRPNRRKKLINNSFNVVGEALEGFVAANPGLRLLKGHRVVIREDIDDLRKVEKVTLVSGGGSGHEPAQAGFVGKGCCLRLCQAMCSPLLRPSPFWLP